MRRWTVLVVVLIGMSRGAHAQSDLSSRLESLSPDDPMSYFLLAETIAYERSDRASHRLARRLLVLAMELDERRGAPLGLASSVCYALADLAEDAPDRRWLLAIAESRVRASQRVVWNPSASLESRKDELSPDEIAEALAKLRDGNPRDAKALSLDSSLPSVLGAYDEHLPSGGIARLIEWMSSNTSCPECRNRRVSRSPGGRARVCRTCAGDPGTHLLDRRELRDLLRLEARLLDAQASTWGGDLLLQGNAPMRTLRIEEIAPRYDIDPLDVVFRDGRWTRRDDRLDPDTDGEYDGGPGSP
ncbi:MAG: hypothetical protein ACF8GE_12075 [Phycisphaerales bacterium JB043]